MRARDMKDRPSPVVMFNMGQNNVMQKPAQKQLGALVAPHLETLYRMAYRLVRNTADAQDLVQDTCVAACNNLASLAAADSPLRWLLRVQHNRFIDGHRRRGRSPIVPAEESAEVDEVASDLPEPSQIVQQFQDLQLLEQAFLQLDPVERMLLSLRAEEYDLPAIEAITGISRSVLSVRLHRARVRLARNIADMHREAGGIRHIRSRT
ncbi:MAG TPA: RNA polymerase sigma factor [Burkholderiales bacterium]|nr:RNA polymerase sigma factor [Burkholderiales bacterium]